MIQLEEPHPAGYGMFVYSPDVFVNFLKTEKCRARKPLTYFDKHRDVFFRAIGGGVAMPFLPALDVALSDFRLSGRRCGYAGGLGAGLPPRRIFLSK